jgi:two-component system LytT family response regulator
VFLDIEMPGADGFALIEGLPPADRPALVVVSAHQHYALRAFQVDVSDYLLKPFGWDRLEATLARVRDEIAQRRQQALSATLEDLIDGYRRQRSLDDRIPVRHHGRVSFVRLGDIDWVDAAHNRVRIHAHGSTYLLRQGITSIEERLDPDLFVRVHRSTIVNVQRIQELQVNASGQYTLVLRNGQRLSVSRSHRDRLRELLRLDDR